MRTLIAAIMALGVLAAAAPAGAAEQTAPRVIRNACAMPPPEPPKKPAAETTPASAPQNPCEVKNPCAIKNPGGPKNPCAPKQ